MTAVAVTSASEQSVGQTQSDTAASVYSPAMAQVASEAVKPLPVPPRQAAQAHWPQSWDELVSELTARSERLPIDYAELIVFNGEQVLQRARFGSYTDEQTPPVLAGQINEILTALAVMQLVERGEWSLFDRVRQRLPELPISNPYAEEHPLLLIHLLEHASGFDQRRFKSHFASPATLTEDITQRLHREASSLQVRWAPGSAARHSVLNYAVLAALLEAHYRRPWAEIIATQITEPLDFAANYLEGARAENVVVSGHSGLPAEPHPLRGRVFNEAEGSWMTIDDSVRLGQHLMSRGASSTPALLRADTITMMEIPRSTLAGDVGLTYGMGAGIDSRARYGLWHGRQSSLDGYSLNLRYNTEQNIGYALVVNHQSLLPALDELVWQYLVAQQPPTNLREGGVNLEQRWQGWYRLQNPQHALLAPLQQIFGIAYIQRDSAELTLKPLIGASVPLRSVDGSRLAHREDGSVVGVLFSDEDGQQRIQVHNDVRLKVSSTAALAPIFLLGLAILILLSHPFARYDSLHQPWMRRLTTLAALCYLLAVFVAGSLNLEQASTDNWRSVLLFVFTTLGPVLGLGALLVTLRGWRHESNQVARWRALIGAVAVAGLALWIIYSGWFALRIWSW